MNPAPRWILGAWSMQVAAWLLPVHESGVTLPRGLPGWEAFRIAASPVWPYMGESMIAPGWAVAATISAATNFLMLASPALVLRRSRASLRLWALAALAAFAVDSFWVLGNLEEAGDLRPGYYLWWCSFLVLGIGLWKLRRPAMCPAGSGADA